MKIKNFKIGAFRRLKNLDLNNIKRLNIIVGKNNTGKTSVIEAMVFGVGIDNLTMLIETLRSRSQIITVENIKNMLEPEDAKEVALSVEYEDSTIVNTNIKCVENTEKVVLENDEYKTKTTLSTYFNVELKKADKLEKSSFWLNFEGIKDKIKIRKDPQLNNVARDIGTCQYVSFSRYDRTGSILEALDKILQNNLRKELIEVLQIFDEQVVNFEVVGENRIVKLFRKNENRALLLNDYGNGMLKAFFIACATLVSTNGTVIIDELEAGIHYKALDKFVQFLDGISKKQNVQIVVTTHSLELIDAFLSNCEAECDELAIYQIRKRKNREENSLKVKCFTGEDLLVVRNELGVDLR